MNGTSLFDYYRKKHGENGEIIFEQVNPEDIKICGKTIEQIIQIIRGLEVERTIGIEMTMENLSYLFKKICDEQNKHLQYQIKSMLVGGEE